MTQTFEQKFVTAAEAISKLLDKHYLEISIYLTQYILTHGEDSVDGLLGFLNYAKENQLGEMDIKITLAHDLNGRNDKMMLPRTSGYAEFA